MFILYLDIEMSILVSILMQFLLLPQYARPHCRNVPFLGVSVSADDAPISLVNLIGRVFQVSGAVTFEQQVVYRTILLIFSLKCLIINKLYLTFPTSLSITIKNNLKTTFIFNIILHFIVHHHSSP